MMELKQSFFNRHAALQSFIDGCSVVFACLDPLAAWFRYAVYCVVLCFSGISVLLRSGRPLTIVRLVIAVIVYSVKRCAVRSFAHIFSKCGKAISPSFAYCDSSPTIILERFTAWISASKDHHGVRPIFRSQASAMFGIFLSLFRHPFSSKTPAGNGSALRESQTGNRFFSSAFAPYKPVPAEVLNRVKSSDKKPAELNADEIFSFSHGGIVT